MKIAVLIQFLIFLRLIDIFFVIGNSKVIGITFSNSLAMDTTSISKASITSEHIWRLPSSLTASRNPLRFGTLDSCQINLRSHKVWFWKSCKDSKCFIFHNMSFKNFIYYENMIHFFTWFYIIPLILPWIVLVIFRIDKSVLVSRAVCCIKSFLE